MNKQQYREARALVRTNGKFAYHWLNREQVDTMEALDSRVDDLAWRASLRAKNYENFSALNICRMSQDFLLCAAIPFPDARQAH